MNHGRALMAMVQGASISSFSGVASMNQHSCCLYYRQCRCPARGSCSQAHVRCALMRHSLVLCSPV